MKLMKKMMAATLALVMLLALAACGGDNGGSSQTEAPDLTKYYEDFMASLGEGNAPAMSELMDETVEGLYPGLNDIATKQKLMQTAMISAVAYEFALVETESAEDAAKVQEIFQARKDAQVDGGAWYPETIESWEKGEIIVNGNVVALIVAGEQQAEAVEAFNALFA